MMTKLLALLLPFLVAAHASAGLVISVAPSSTFVEGSGTQFVDIFARSDNSDLVNGFALDIGLSGTAIFLDNPNVGNFGNAGTIGNGLDLSNSSFLRQDPVNQVATLGIVFNDGNAGLGGIQPVLFPSTNTVVGRIAINTTNLASQNLLTGVTYTVTPLSLSGAPVTSLSAGTFSITAVPEPSSMVLMGLSVAGFGAYARFRKGKKKAVAA